MERCEECGAMCPMSPCDNCVGSLFDKIEGVINEESVYDKIKKFFTGARKEKLSMNPQRKLFGLDTKDPR